VYILSAKIDLSIHSLVLVCIIYYGYACIQCLLYKILKTIYNKQSALYKSANSMLNSHILMFLLYCLAPLSSHKFFVGNEDDLSKFDSLTSVRC